MSDISPTFIEKEEMHKAALYIPSKDLITWTGTLGYTSRGVLASVSSEIEDNLSDGEDIVLAGNENQLLQCFSRVEVGWKGGRSALVVGVVNFGNGSIFRKVDREVVWDGHIPVDSDNEDISFVY